MIPITVRRIGTLSTAMERLRAEGLGCPSLTSRDRFDEGSIHVTAFVAKRPVGMVRVTTSGPSILESWSADGWPLPVGEGVVELTRGVVAPDCRGFGIYRLLMLEVMASLAVGRFRIATAAIEPDFVGRHFLTTLGFHVGGSIQVFRDTPREHTVVVPILAGIDAAAHRRWSSMLMATRAMQHPSEITVAE